MLWIALRFPLLPLEIFSRAVQEAVPVAVSDSTGVQARIVSANAEAQRHGVRPGMAVAGAWALSSRLKVFTREEPVERAALERIGAWALQFTPVVSLAESPEVLLEVGGSLRLFGGLGPLWSGIEKGLSALGYTATAAAAPTPLAAQWFARAGLSTRIRHPDALRLELEKLPLTVVSLSGPLSEFLEKIGVRTLGECLQLPRDGLARRGGQELLGQLDRALGRSPDPRPVLAPADRFRASLQLPAPAEQAEEVLFAARRLLTELCGLLAATAKGVQSLRIDLRHERRAPTRIELNLLGATRDPAHLSSVLRERLQRVSLPAPAVELALESGAPVPLHARNASFLPDDRAGADTFARLIERLRARLGEDAVQGFDAIADHRPERAWRTCEPGKEVAAASCLPASTRPLWLLHAPRRLAEIGELPHYEGGRLALLTRPELIESGWWDGRDVAREYYVARSPAQSLLWIYRESGGKGGWYLHGFFS